VPMWSSQAPAKWAVGEWAEGSVAEALHRVVKVWAAVPGVEAPDKGEVAKVVNISSKELFYYLKFIHYRFSIFICDLMRF